MKKYTFIIATAVFALTSCSFLDRNPKDKLAPENFFRNEQDFELFSNTFYDNLFDKEPYKKQSDIIFCKGAISDELLGGTAREVPTVAGKGGWSWGQLRKINTMLDNMDKCSDTDVVKKYTALGRFFRTRFYFEKVKRFGDVPWYEHELGSTDTDELYKPRDSRELVMSHMIEDIDYAIENLTSEKSVYRVNRWAALMLKAQFCLYEGTFRKYHNINIEGGLGSDDYLRLAADAAYEIITKGPYSLAPDYGKLFRDLQADQNEYILAINMEDGIATHNATGYCLMVTAGCPGFSKKFIDSFLMKNGEPFSSQPGWETMPFVEQMKDRDPRLGMITRLPDHVRVDAKTTIYGPDIPMTSTGYQYDKFVMSTDYPTAGRADMSFNDIPIYRLAEAYLIYAEAKAELNEFTQDVADISINKLRSRVNMPAMTVASLTVDPFLISDEYGYTNLRERAPGNMAQILEIRRERTIELVMEASSRWDDIVRWKEGKCYEQPLRGMYFPGPGEYDITGDGVADLCLYKTASKPAGYPDEFLCLQIQEIEIDGKNVPLSDGGIVLSNGDSGYVEYFRTKNRSFNEERDYLYPIPTEDRSTNPNLKQNPGWNDGLSEESSADTDNGMN